MNSYLIVASLLNLLVAAIHIGCIVFGAPWYRFFGAGESMAKMAERGSAKPALITAGITVTFVVWAIYAFAAAGLPFAVNLSLPWVRPVLAIIVGIYLVRGLLGFLLIKKPLGRSPSFWIYSSLVCLLIGSIHLAGLLQQWSF